MGERLPYKQEVTGSSPVPPIGRSTPDPGTRAYPLTRVGKSGETSTVDRVSDDPDLDAFEELVADAIDALPEEFQKVLEKVAVVVSDLGTEHHAYGMYYGDGVARAGYEDRIVIYRDTLERDFGHDPRLLARQVERTLRHELAHHLGWDEGGVGGLGL